MKSRWMIVSAVALLALAAVILLGQGVGQAQMPTADLTVVKSVSPSAVAPGQYATYSVTLHNTTGARKDVSSLVDILPDDFEYVGLEPGTQWGTEPWDKTAPDIQWAGPIPVPANGSLTLRYKVYVPDSVPLSPDPHVNTVTATLLGIEYPAEAGLLVAVGEVSVNKVAASKHVYPGDLMTYTVTFGNSGYVPQSLTKITDLLPEDVTFVRMTPNSQVLNPPSGSAGTITWMGPFAIPSLDSLVLEYVTAMPETSDTLYLKNLLSGQLDNGAVVTDNVEVRVSTSQTSTVYMPFIPNRWAAPYFVAAKTATPSQVIGEAPAALITYEVLLSNVGTDPGVVANIHDTLPAGFTFITMLPGSGVSTPPSGTTGEIIWSGPFTVPGKSSLNLKYQVRASITPGTYTNGVLANVSKGQPSQVSAAAAVVVREPYLLLEEWDNPSPYWEEFVNYWRLNGQQWHIKPTGGDNGLAALGHTYFFGVSDPLDGAHDALIMYKGPGAEQWTDYEFRARAILYADDGSGRGQIGMWFRGTGKQEGQPSGRYVTGYYFSLQPISPKRVLLLQMRTDDECGSDCNYNYHFSNPLLLDELRGAELVPLGLDLQPGRWYWLKVRVEGPRIRCYVDDVLVFDYNDNVGTAFTTGSIGFYTYIAGDARFDHVIVEPLD